VLQQLGDTQLAISHLQQSLSYEPNDPTAYHTLGMLWCEMGALDGGVSCFEQAIALAPDFAEAHWELAQALLKLEQWARGWKESEWRWSAPSYLTQQLPRHRKIAAWTSAENLKGKTILAWAENDVAASVMFARCLPLLKLRNPARIVVECDASVTEWMTSLDCVDQVVVRSDKPPKAIDFQISLGSLPAVLGCDKWPDALTGDPVTIPNPG
jgi:hypothetical protein